MKAAEKLLATRRDLVAGVPIPARKAEGEGGCGVLGVASSRPVEGRHILRAMGRMRNRGNGKGGGIAAAGLRADELGVSEAILRNDYLVQIAYLDPSSRSEVERSFLEPVFEVDHRAEIPVREAGQVVPPPLVWRYFCRPRREAIERFASEHGLEELPEEAIADELVYRTSYLLNRSWYFSLGDKRAFVLCHGKDLVVFKVVGYAEDVIAAYGLGHLSAHVWIGHQRYPTKGRVWHPGGAHPFVGLHEALVHNGDFANYHAISEYLAQRNVRPLFLTDTEVAVLLFDLWTRVYGYPLEYAIEALAPTTERDFELLGPERRAVYRAIQAAHIHGSPDGPWFFILARSIPTEGAHELMGITDTSMLRPQVFALHGGDWPIGLVASERQAIRAFLESLSDEHEEVCPVPDRAWVARGGSHTDGGAFVFRLAPPGEGGFRPLVCTNKFGALVEAAEPTENDGRLEMSEALEADPPRLEIASGGASLERALETLTERLDRRAVPPGEPPHRFRARTEREIVRLLDSVPSVGRGDGGTLLRIGWEERERLCPPTRSEQGLVVDARGFPPEGTASLASFLVRAVEIGWKHLIVYAIGGQRFLGCGLGPRTEGVRLDLYGAVGDYAASGLDGADLRIHGDAQDQVGQIFKSGKLVIYGDVGQTFLYGAKGGEIYVLGSAAGRPLICAVGRPRAVINGTCLDYLAESFMAGDPLAGGGFAVLNALRVDGRGGLHDLDDPYPGGNLLSLASGGAVYVRDPFKKIGPEQLNGGRIEPLAAEDWKVILPCLEENERLFGIPIERLLTVRGRRLSPEQVYRKVCPTPVRALEPVAFQLPVARKSSRGASGPSSRSGPSLGLLSQAASSWVENSKMKATSSKPAGA
jgi:glutamate synthase domain-containing protein 1/glutamate synthase domain-containing protein 3